MLEQWANHNNIALLATRLAKPRDKASVEGAVKITYQRIYAPLRNETFKSISELNLAISLQLKEHHQKNFQRKTFSRTELFESSEKPVLNPLPASSFVMKHYTGKYSLLYRHDGNIHRKHAYSPSQAQL